MPADNTAGAPPVVGANQIKLGAGNARPQAALASLEAVFKSAPEICQSFLRGRNILSEHYRIESACGAAHGAGDIRIIFQPTDHFCHFLLATRAGHLQKDIVGI